MHLALSNGKQLRFDGRPLLMAILNVTPDSFSDGGEAVTPEAALAKARRLVEEGADVLDVGGESTRPGFASVTEAEETRRVVPVIQLLRENFPEMPISVDTSKPSVAYAAIQAGADILNDVTALEHGGLEMASVLQETGAACVLMHAVPSPTGKTFPDALASYFEARLAWCAEQGIASERIVLDPGICFANDLSQNLACISSLPRLHTLNRPILIGHSRKSFLGLLTGRPVHERLLASTAAATLAAYLGAEILRVHDVAATKDAIAVATALRPSFTPSSLPSKP